MIDDKLKEIIYSLNPNRAWYERKNLGVNKRGEAIPKKGSNYSEVDVFVAQIKAAFADAGYGTIKELAALLTKQPFMTGQEWEERFEKEITSYWSKEELEQPNQIDFSYEEIIEAAKKASSPEGTSGL